MERLFAYLAKSETIKNSALTSGANLFASGISAVALLWVSRQLGPESFGIFSAIFSLIMITIRLLDLGINLATQRYIAGTHDQTLIAHTIRTISLIKLTTILIMALSGVLLGVQISQFLHIQDAYLVQWSLILGSIMLAYEWILAAIQGLNQFFKAAVMMTIPALAKLLTVAALSTANLLTVTTATLSYMVLPFLGLGYGLVTLKDLWFSGNYFSSRIIKTIFDISKWTSLAIISSAIADNIDVLLIQMFLDSFSTGLYAAASRIAWLYSLVAVSVGLVLSVRAAKFKTQHEVNVYVKKVTYAGLLAIGLTLLLIPTSQIVLGLIGGEYQQAAPILSLLLLATGLTGFTVGYQALFYFFNKPQYYAWSGLLLMLIVILGDWILIPLFDIWGAAIAKVISRLSVLVFTLWYTRRAYKELYEH